MLTTIGILLIIFGILSLVLKAIFTTNKFLNSITKTRSIQLTILGIVVSVITGMFFYADAGTAYAVQFISGGDKMITTQGIKLKYWARVIPLSYEISIKDIIVDDKNELPDDGQGIYNRQAQRWEFSDAIKAEISTSVIVGVNINDEDVFLNKKKLNGNIKQLLELPNN